MKGIIKKIIPLAPRDIGEAGGYRSILLRDGTAVLGGKIHGETYNLAVKAGFPEDEIGAGIAGFTRPDGTTWDLHGKFGKAKRVVFVEDQPWKQTRTGIRLNRDIDLAIKAAMGAVAGGMMFAPDEAEAMSMKPLRDVITKGGGTAASVGEPMIPVADKENLFNQIGKRLIAELQGQGILDNMEDMGKSPLVAAKEFWERTYWKLSSDEQMFFRRQLQNHTGRRDDDIRELLKNQDLPREIEYLEGTDRGYVSLMEYMNQKVTTTKAALKHIPFAPVAIGAAGAMIPFEAGAAPTKPMMTMTDIVNKWRAEGRQIPYQMEREAWREQAQARGMLKGLEEAYGPGDLAADVLTGGASMGARAATKGGMAAIKGGMAAGATGFGLDTATRLLFD